MAVVRDWCELRLALGLTQRDMGAVLGVCKRRVQRIEAGVARLDAAIERRLAHYLALRGARARLKRAGVPHPFADERAAAVAVWNRTVHRQPSGLARPCAVCGVPLGLHLRCARCPQLVGDAHGQPLASDGLCRGCRAAVRAAGELEKRRMDARKSA